MSEAKSAAAKDYKRLNPDDGSYIRSGGMQIELRWFIDAVCPWVYCNAVSVHILFVYFASLARWPLFSSSSYSPFPRDRLPLSFVGCANNVTCNMVITVKRSGS